MYPDKFVLTWRLCHALNVSLGILLDFTDGDGKVELTVAYSDRVVRCFRWSTVQDPDTEAISSNLIQTKKWQLAGQVIFNELSLPVKIELSENLYRLMLSVVKEKFISQALLPLFSWLI